MSVVERDDGVESNHKEVFVMLVEEKKAQKC